MSGAVRYLDLEDLLHLTRVLSVGPVRDLGLLESAAARPRGSALGEDVYPRLETKAAALLHSIAGNHPLVDGNKRLAWLATVVFLDVHGHRPALTDDEAFELVMDVAAGGLDVETIVARLAVTPS